jgi:hypothetical protein
MDEQQIAERVAKDMTAGKIMVPALDESGRTAKIPVENIVWAFKSGEPEKPYCQVGPYVLDAENLDTLIDTLKSAQRRLK